MLIVDFSKEADLNTIKKIKEENFVINGCLSNIVRRLRFSFVVPLARKIVGIFDRSTVAFFFKVIEKNVHLNDIVVVMFIGVAEKHFHKIYVENLDLKVKVGILLVGDLNGNKENLFFFNRKENMKDRVNSNTIKIIENLKHSKIDNGVDLNDFYIVVFRESKLVFNNRVVVQDLNLVLRVKEMNIAKVFEIDN